VTIPGVDFANDDRGGARSGDFRVVEPRPVFVAGRLVYLVSIIPDAANSVSKTVIVDAERNKVVTIFDNDTDPQAEARTLKYLATGVVPPVGSDAGSGETETAPEPSSSSPSSTATPGSTKRPSDAQVRKRLDAIIAQQEKLIEEARKLRESLSADAGG
jgi:hypothetical protein